mgnify:CR=1 FL=1
MQMNYSLKKILILLTGLFFSSPFSIMAHADWVLDPETSHLVYGSIKKNSIGENNHFQKIESRISEKGEIILMIDLASVETWVDIRNDRMKEFIFKTARFPVATLRGQVDMNKFREMPIGSQMIFDMDFELGLNGLTQPIEAELVIIRLAKDQIIVLNQEIIFLDAEKFNLLPGLKKLEELAELPSISTIVPVVFRLTFNHTLNNKE